MGCSTVAGVAVPLSATSVLMVFLAVGSRERDVRARRFSEEDRLDEVPLALGVDPPIFDREVGAGKMPAAGD